MEKETISRYGQVVKIMMNPETPEDIKNQCSEVGLKICQGKSVDAYMLACKIIAKVGELTKSNE